jgi:GNAT superfamily N-acetyltransferase
MTAHPFQLPLKGTRVAIEAGPGEGHLLVRSLVSGDQMGCVEWTLSDGTLHIAALAIHEQHRGYGAGSEAARLLVEAAGESAVRMTAWAPPHLGLAVYFWFRMGLRPVPGEGPAGGLLFERSVSARQPHTS